MKIFTVYTNFLHIGGAERVALQIHNMLKGMNGNECFVMAQNSFEDCKSEYGISKNEFVSFSWRHFKAFKGATFISHHRKMTTMLVSINRVLRLKMRIIHVAHNQFFDLKSFSFFPKEVIAVSNRVKENLENYFGLKQPVTVIYNGLIDRSHQTTPQVGRDGDVKILYAGRITPIKQQIDVFGALNGKLKNNITIDFAGVGEDFDALSTLTKENPQFNCLGFVELRSILGNYDYVMLYSKNEGLPLTLIEACIYGKPIICNDIGGNCEIAIDDENGFIVNDFEMLLSICNDLPQRNEMKYEIMADKSRAMYVNNFTEGKMIEKYKRFIFSDQ